MMRRTVGLLPILCAVMLAAKQEVRAQDVPIPNSACTYRPSTRIEPVVSLVVMKDSSATFHFSYRLRNGGGAVQNIDVFKIEIPGGASNLQAPGEWDGSFFKYKPIGGWHEVSENRDLVVRPGQEVSGFQFESKGLPSIASFWARGEEAGGEDAGVSCPDGQADDEAAAYADFFFDSVKGKTIGPTAPPTVFEPLWYAGYLLDVKNQSFTVGWIKEQQTADALDAKLVEIRELVRAGLSNNRIPLSKGTKILELGAQFLQFVESNSCKDFDCAESRPLTSESYALLFYNMDYFLNQVRKACEQPAQLPPPIPSPAPKRKK